MRFATMPQTWSRRTVWGVSLTRAVAGIAIVALAASIFFPAFQAQYAAARRAAMHPAVEQAVVGTTILPDTH